MYHGMEGTRLAADFADREIIPAFNSQGVLVQSTPLRLNGGISVVRTNYRASNGVTHVIGGVLAPEWVDNTLFRFAETTTDLSLFLEFIVLANLEYRLDYFDDVKTLIYPTNDAVRKIDAATLAFWRDPANLQDLRRIVDYHIVDGVSAVLVDGDSLETNALDYITYRYLQIEVSVKGDTIMFNQATIQSDGRLAYNGLLYTIDAVLNPDLVDGF
jgi:uncharacterized surface protein with fasciclin (FAS1) repeats